MSQGGGGAAKSRFSMLSQISLRPKSSYFSVVCMMTVMYRITDHIVVTSSPRPWIAVYDLPEESTFFNMAVTEGDLDPKV